MLPSDALRTFEAWAPPGQRWTPWAKPVLFTYPADVPAAGVPAWAHAPGLLPQGDGSSAVIVDLPGAEGVACGLALAARGFAPVPLYNVTKGEGQEVVEVEPLISALVAGAGVLSRAQPRDDAPPAFLIDSRRRAGRPSPRAFDNRWMVFPQDFPSARALAAAGVSRVLHLSLAGEAPGPDLRSVLRLWKREGLALEQLDPAIGRGRALDFDVSILAVFGDHVSALFHGLRENAAGGFGGRVPMPQSTSGGYM